MKCAICFDENEINIKKYVCNISEYTGCLIISVILLMKWVELNKKHPVLFDDSCN